MGIERKRSPVRDPALVPNSSYSTASTSSSSFGRHTANIRSATLPPPRTESPPASAYFTQFSVDDTYEPHPSADATSHFAYSTTLRRHHPEGPLSFPQTPHGAALPTFDEIRSVVAEEGPTGLWQRTVGTIKSYFPGSAHEDYERLPSRRDEHKETPSARFALFSAEVRLVSSPTASFRV